MFLNQNGSGVNRFESWAGSKPHFGFPPAPRDSGPAKASRVSHIEFTAEDADWIAYMLANNIGDASFMIGRDAGEMAAAGAPALISCLSSADLELITQFGQGIGNPALVMKGLPLPEDLPATPQEFGDDTEVQSADCLLMAAIETAGAKPIAYGFENLGHPIRNVAPSARARDVASSHGARQMLGWHTDNPWPFEGTTANRSPAPRFLCFFGLRINDAYGVPVPTEILPFESILTRTASGLLKILESPEFTVNPPPSNQCGPLENARLVEYDRSGQAFLRFNAGDGQIEGQTPRARTAIREFCDVLAECEDLAIEVFVHPGTILMFDNYRVLHRRRSFDPGEDLTEARWMRRCFACQNPANGQFVDRTHRPLVWK